MVGRKKRGVTPVSQYPDHIENYKVNPFIEEDWVKFWEQVEYDWDTEDFKYARREGVNMVDSIFKNARCLGPKLNKKYGNKQPYVLYWDNEEENEQTFENVEDDLQSVQKTAENIWDTLVETVEEFGQQFTPPNENNYSEEKIASSGSENSDKFQWIRKTGERIHLDQQT